MFCLVAEKKINKMKKTCIYHIIMLLLAKKPIAGYYDCRSQKP